MTPSHLQIRIEKRLSNFRLSVDLAIGAEILVLFGPSGAGKTQTLNAVAGLLTPDSGEIIFDGTTLFRREVQGEVVNLPARMRRIGYVFQQYALFPHMTALQNVAYPLKPPNDRNRALDLLSQMHLEDLADRYPHELSGGQQQRVAIARALAADSKVLLLDEPFSALDQPIRQRLHAELRSLQAQTGLVVLYVTHNLEDALTVGHRLAILHEGRLEQVAGIDEIFLRPANRKVMEILGLPNIFEARIIESSSDRALIDWNGLKMRIGHSLTGYEAPIAGYIPPAEIELIAPSAISGCDDANYLSGHVISSRPSGGYHRLIIRLENGSEIEVVTSKASAANPGSSVRLRISEDGIIVVESKK